MNYLHEWYEEDYDPSPHEQVFRGMPPQPNIQYLTRPGCPPDIKVGQVLFVNGKPTGIVLSIDHNRSKDSHTIQIMQQGLVRNQRLGKTAGIHALFQVVDEATKPFKKLQKFVDTMGKAIFPAPPSFDPRVPTRPAHSMTPRKNTVYDHLGRKRY